MTAGGNMNISEQTNDYEMSRDTEGKVLRD